jgi:hypothetical protein
VRVERRELRDTTKPEVDLLLLVREGGGTARAWCRSRATR